MPLLLPLLRPSAMPMFDIVFHASREGMDGGGSIFVMDITSRGPRSFSAGLAAPGTASGSASAPSTPRGTRRRRRSNMEGGPSDGTEAAAQQQQSPTAGSFGQHQASAASGSAAISTTQPEVSNVRMIPLSPPTAFLTRLFCPHLGRATLQATTAWCGQWSRDVPMHTPSLVLTT